MTNKIAKNIIMVTLLSLFSYSANAITNEQMIKNSVEERMSLSNIENNKNYYQPRTKEDIKLLIRLMKRAFLDSRTKEEGDYLKFTETLSKQVETLTSNMIKNRNLFKLELIGFKNKNYNEIKHIEDDNLFEIESDNIYLLDFNKKEISEAPRLIQDLKVTGREVLITFKSALDYLVIIYPNEKKNSFIKNENVNYEKIKETILNKKPNFKL